MTGDTSEVQGPKPKPETEATRLETIGAIADIANKVIVSLAVCVGAAWAFYKFELSESPSAQLELDRVKRICSERGSLDIKIEARSEGKTLLGKVVVKNIGTRAVVLDMTDGLPPIEIAELTFGPHSEAKASNIVEAGFPFIYSSTKELTTITYFSSLPGRTVELHFGAAIPHSGIYLISFNGGRRQVEPDDKVCKADTPQENMIWAATDIQRIEIK